MEDHKGVKTGLEGEGDGQTSCLWAYLVDLAHSYNFLSASRAQPDLPGNQAWSCHPSMLSNMQPPLGCVLSQSHSCGGGSLHSPRSTVSGAGRLFLHNAHSPQAIDLYS